MTRGDRVCLCEPMRKFVRELRNTPPWDVANLYYLVITNGEHWKGGSGKLSSAQVAVCCWAHLSEVRRKQEDRSER